MSATILPAARRRMAVANLVLAPFLLAFLLIYFFMRNAERLYHQPSAAGARRWSPLAAWRLREFNELPHYTAHRWRVSPARVAYMLHRLPGFALSLCVINLLLTLNLICIARDMLGSSNGSVFLRHARVLLLSAMLVLLMHI